METVEAKSVVENAEQNKIERLFSGLGFNLITRNLKVRDNNGIIIGEIDLIYRFENYFFIIEVSHRQRDINEKASAFFSKWSARDNLSYLVPQIGWRRLKIYRIFIDLSQTSEFRISASLKHYLERPENKYLFEDDIEYFIDTQSKVGIIARNDLLSYLDIPRKEISQRIDAIQFYIGKHPAFAFVANVSTLLEACYVSRRRKRDLGFQRALNYKRITRISKDIKQKKILAYPNSIVVNSQTILIEQKVPENLCPKKVIIHLPISYCELKIIDGQHRLLGFANVDDKIKEESYLSVIAFEKLSHQEEMKIFIDINSKQKKVDRNLVLFLKADFEWDKTDKEYFEKISVKIAEQLNKHGPLKNKIYLGSAMDKPGGKVTLTTLVSALIKNNLVGRRLHLFQSNIDDVDTPVRKTNKLLSTIKQKLKFENFFLGNKGLRIMFRFIQIVERNNKVKKISMDYESIFDDLGHVISIDYIDELQVFYGEGGANKAADKLISSLKEKYPEKYRNFEQDLRKLPIIIKVP